MHCFCPCNRKTPQQLDLIGLDCSFRYNVCVQDAASQKVNTIIAVYEFVPPAQQAKTGMVDFVVIAKTLVVLLLYVKQL